MKIVLVNQFYAPDEAATGQMAADLGAALVASGHEVYAICCNRSYADPSRRYGSRDAIDGVDVHRVRITGFGRRSAIGRCVDYALFAVGAALRLLRLPRPDVVLSLTTPPMIGLVGALGARARGARTALWSMDVYPDVAYELAGLKPTSVAGTVLRHVSRLTHRMQDLVIALGESMAEMLRDCGSKRVETVHNWADEASIRPADPQHSSMRREQGWGNRFVVMYSGNLGLAHEFDTLLSAADVLREDHSILFAIVGAGPRLASARRRCDELRLPNVTFCAPVPRERLSDTLAAADLQVITLRPQMAGLVVPSKIYGILAAGRPTLYIGPPRGEVFRIINENECGTNVTNVDVANVVRAVCSYRDDHEMRISAGRRARETFDRSFTKRRGTEKIRDLLEDLDGSVNSPATDARRPGASPIS